MRKPSGPRKPRPATAMQLALLRAAGSKAERLKKRFVPAHVRASAGV